MLNMLIKSDPDTNEVQSLAIAPMDSKIDVEFVTKLTNVLLRGGTVVLDPGQSTQLAYVAGVVASINGESV